MTDCDCGQAFVAPEARQKCRACRAEERAQRAEAALCASNADVYRFRAGALEDAAAAIGATPPGLLATASDWQKWLRSRASEERRRAPVLPSSPDVLWAAAVVDSARGLDTDARVRFYEHDFYPLSNFSSFTLQWRGLRFDTSEAAYHWEKFPNALSVRRAIREAPSAHEAFKTAEHFKAVRRPDWDEVKVGIMREILRAKVAQHEYARRKLLATGDRELVEDSWRDDFWGWGPNRDGENMLGKLWMEIRAELRAKAAP